MITLVVGASGATGKLLVEQLLHSEQRVKIVIRSTSIISFGSVGTFAVQLTRHCNRTLTDIHFVTIYN